MPDINDKEIDYLIKFAKSVKADTLIQKFLYNIKGRNPVKEESWESFYDRLKELEKKHDVKLIKASSIIKTKELLMPFKKGDIIKAKIVCEGRYFNERIAVSKERVITVISCLENINKEVKIRILKSNHNIFIAEKI